MKIKVEYSESIQVAEGLWRKIGIEVSGEENDNPNELYEIAKSRVDKWHSEALGPFSPPTRVIYSEPTQNPHNSVIQVEKPSYDKMVTAMLGDIAACTTIEELKTYRHVAAANVYADSAYNSKMEKLSNSELVQ